MLLALVCSFHETLWRIVGTQQIQILFPKNETTACWAKKISTFNFKKPQRIIRHAKHENSDSLVWRGDS